jgi:hypothetical protein
MSKITVQIMGGHVNNLELDVGEDGVSPAEIKEMLGKRLGPAWRYSALLVGGRSSDYLGSDHKIKEGEVVAALRQVQGS